MIQVKNKNGEVILEQNESTYTGGFMAERSVSFSVESPRKIALNNESYVEYRGEIFVLQKTPVPTVKKISSPESIGNAFKYDLKFVSLADYELKATGFIDSIHGENSGYYTGSSTVEFRGNVSYLISRIQSCLDSKYYGDKAWNIILDDGIITEDVNISVTDITCWDALCLVNSTEAWGLNFFISGRNIHVTNCQDRIEYPFEYGIGNGLYELERSAVDTDPIVTRLRVYGSTDNIPADYRREIGITGRIAPDSQYSKNLMLPDYAYIPEAKVHAKSKGDYSADSAYEKGDLILSPQKEYFYCIKNSSKGTGLSNLEYFAPYKDNYIESANISIYGIRDGVFRDESIKPTISGITISDLEYYKVIPSNTGSKSRIDEILAVSAISTANENLATFDIWVRNIGFNVFSSNASGVSAKIEITSSPTGVSGFDFEVSACVEDTTSYPESKYKITLKKNTSESFVVPNIDTNIYSLSDGVNLVPDGVYARFVVTDVAMPFFYIQSAERRLLESGENKLSTIDSPLSAYSLGVDEIEISRNRQDLCDSISEGNLIGVYDEDVYCGVLLSNNENFNTDIHPRWDDSASNIIFGTNKFNLGIVPSGTRASVFSGIGKFSYIWTSDIYDANNAIAKRISFDSSNVESVFLDRNNGASVILVRDARSGEVGLDDGTIRYSVYKDSNNVVYDGVKIGNKVWLSSPLKESKYFNEDGSDSLFFNSQKYKYLHQYVAGTEYSIGESILKPSGISIAAPSGETAPNTDAYYYKSGSGINDWTQLISAGCRYLGEYKTWIPYAIGDIVIFGHTYYKNISPSIGIGVSDKTKWAVDNSYPNIRIDRLISGLDDAEWMSANFGALSVYPFSGVLPSENDMISEYGRLYNHYSVENPIGLVNSATGFRIPSSIDFSSLENYIKSKYQSESSFGIGNLLKSKRQIGTPLDGGVSDIKLCQYISIQTLTIKEGFSPIPQYQITLSSKPIASKLDAVSSTTKSNSDKIYTVASSAQTASKVVEKSIESVRAEIPSSPADTGSEPAILPKQNGILSWLNSAWVFLEDTFVRNTRKINGKTLGDDITLTTLDISETTNRRYQSDLQSSVNDATSSIQTQINYKQTKLPFPETPTGDTFLNDLGLFSTPPSTGGGSASGTPLYFLPTNSLTSGYLELDYTPYSSVVEIPYSIPVGTTLLSSHLSDLGIATTTIDAGNWFISSRSKVNNLSGSVKLHVDFILYHIDGTTTVLFGGDSEIFNSTDFKVYSGQLPEASFSCVVTDRIGVKIYAINSGGATKTLTTSLGLGISSFFTTPLRIRHSSLIDKNGESAFQHVTTDQISTWNAKQPALGFTPEQQLTFGTGLSRTGNTITNSFTAFKTVNSVSVVGNGDISINPFPGFGTGNGAAWGYSAHPTTVSGYGITDIPTYSGSNFILNQNSSAQSANMWIRGKLRNSILNNASFISNWGGSNWFGIGGTTSTQHLIRLGMTDEEGVFQSAPGDILFQVDGAATFASTVNSAGFLLNGNNLTSSLSTNYIPKWNGSSFVNSLISDDGTLVKINSSNMLRGGVNNIIYAGTSGLYFSSNDGATDYLKSNSIGITIYPTTASTSPTTGALIVGGGIGADHVRANNFYGSGANLTNLPINLTTTGTSGAATYTKSTNTLNVPNYTAASNVVLLSPATAQSGAILVSGNITSLASVYCSTIQPSSIDVGNSFTVINGSTSGDAQFSMPFRGNGSFKKITIRLNSLIGTASWTFPTAFGYTPVVINTTGLSSSKVTSLTTTGVTITGANDTGYLTIEGY